MRRRASTDWRDSAAIVTIGRVVAPDQPRLTGPRSENDLSEPRTGQTDTVQFAPERLAAVEAAAAAQLARIEEGRARLAELTSDRVRLLTSARTLVGQMHATVDNLVADITLPPPSGVSIRKDLDVWRLHVAYSRRGDPQVLDRLVRNYLPRAERHARTGTRRLHDLDDRLQVAREALVLALQRFEPHRRLPFQPFADATITGQLQKHIRDHGWLVRVPRRVHELVPAIRAATEELAQELDRAPTPDEIAERLGCPTDDVLTALSAHRARTHESLDAFVTDEHPNYERLGSTDSRFRVVDDRDALRRALATFAEDDRALLRAYFVDGKTQQEIADELERSQMHVSRRLRRVLRVLAARVDGETSRQPSAADVG